MEMLLQEYYYLEREMINYTGFKPTASCRRQPKLFARLPAIFHQRTRILLKILCLSIFRLKLKSLSYYGEHFISGNKVTNVLKAVCKRKWDLKRATGSIFVYSIQLSTYFFKRDITGGPSSSCEMIILRNNSYSGIIRVCMGIFMIALGIKKYVKFSIKIPHLTSTMYRLRSDRLLWWKEPILRKVRFLCTLKTSKWRTR